MHGRVLRESIVQPDPHVLAFAKLDQTTVSASARLNYTATPDLTFEFYAAPFTSNGTYANLESIEEVFAVGGNRAIELAGAGSPETLAAILTLLPVDTLVAPAAFTMAVAGNAPAESVRTR